MLLPLPLLQRMISYLCLQIWCALTGEARCHYDDGAKTSVGQLTFGFVIQGTFPVVHFRCPT